jgi:hypothetical protein
VPRLEQGRIFAGTQGKEFIPKRHRKNTGTVVTNKVFVTSFPARVTVTFSRFYNGAGAGGVQQ